MDANKLKNLLSYDEFSGEFTWIARRGRIQPGTVAGKHIQGYRMIRINGKDHFAHRLAFVCMTGRLPDGVVDHINGIRDDNRWVNLRDCSQRENLQNQRSATANNKSSRLLGVSWRKRDAKWVAQIRSGGRAVHLGLFQSKEDAHSAYLKAKRLLHPGCTI